jgi:hypothetical protein
MAIALRLAAPSSRGVGLAMEGPSTPPAQPPQTQATATIELDVPWGLQAMQMPTQKEQAALFAQLDFNGEFFFALGTVLLQLCLTVARRAGNGVLSLAEVDAAVTAIWPTFTHRAAVLRAFRAVDPKSSGLIEPGSFGTLLAYLSAFAGILDEFDQIDTSHDHRLSDSTITKEEVVGACALLKVGVTTAEARQAFDRMEQVRPNHILFDDFAGWIAGRAPLQRPTPHESHSSAASLPACTEPLRCRREENRVAVVACAPVAGAAGQSGLVVAARPAIALCRCQGHHLAAAAASILAILTAVAPGPCR